MTTTSHAAGHEHGLSLEDSLDFLNTHTLAGGQLVDRLERPADASDWFVEHGVVHDPGARPWTTADLDRVRRVRDALREVVDSVVEQRPPRGDAMDQTNLAIAGGLVPVIEVDGSDVRVGHRHAASSVDEALAALAAPIVGELQSGRPERFRTCANDTCRWTFFDTSPTGRRRWCDMKICGNRAKASRHRQRIRLETAPPA